MEDLMTMKMKRTGPRFTVWFDFDTGFLKPGFQFSVKTGLGYIQGACISIGFGFGGARDLMWDMFQAGVNLKLDGNDEE